MRLTAKSWHASKLGRSLGQGFDDAGPVNTKIFKGLHKESHLSRNSQPPPLKPFSPIKIPACPTTEATTVMRTAPIFPTPIRLSSHTHLQTPSPISPLSNHITNIPLSQLRRLRARRARVRRRRTFRAPRPRRRRKPRWHPTPHKHGR